MSSRTRTASATVLVIDDEESIRGLISRVLNKSGYTVVEAADGASGIDLAEKHCPDLILMDIGMPEMDGYEVTQRLKENPQLANIPVIFLTGKTAEEDAGRSFAHGALTFMRKPFSAQALADLVSLTLQSLSGG